MNDIMHIMLDLETLGNKTSPVIIQIAAVPFTLNEGTLCGEYFEELIDPTSCVKKGLNVDGDTVTWWLKQDKDVVRKVFSESVNAKPIDEVLMEFSEWIRNLQLQGEIRVWGNGLMSDNRWLLSAFEKCGIQNPIRHWQHSDVRTLVDLGENILGRDWKSETVFVGEKHNAIDDCKHQIEYVCKIYEELGKLK